MVDSAHTIRRHRTNRLRRFVSFTLLLLGGCSGRSSSPAETVSVFWTYEPPERGAIFATPAVHDEDVYVVTIQDAAFHNLGTLRQISLATGKPRWKFDEDGDMRHGISSPAAGAKTVFVGEGMHANHFCHLYAIDSATGNKRWKFRAEGHIESSPVHSGGDVIFGAGDDGVYSLNAATGKENWHFARSIHVDSRPEVSDRHVFVSAGVSRAFREPRLVCLNRLDGSLAWEFPTDLPAWGSPRLHESTVYFGLGNGRLNRSASGSEKPAGAVIALEASSGKRLWRFDTPDAVMSRPAADGDRVFFTCRDHHLYCLNRADGQLIWKQSLGSPIVADAVRADDRVYAVSFEGRVACFSSKDGKERWRFEIGTHSGTKPAVLASPVVVRKEGSPNRVILGTELKNGGDGAAVLYCLQESSLAR
jgi:outer membrane protein assembly factor BamB